MTQRFGEHSATNATHHLKGAQFPAPKEDVLAPARENDAGQDPVGERGIGAYIPR
jgi:hypothetical protein